MATIRLETFLNKHLEELERTGRLKGAETVIAGIIAAGDGKGPRYLLKGHGHRPFLRMNSNNYLGLALHSTVKAAEEAAVQLYGTGPGAVRFISGTWEPHVALERGLAAFHDRPAAMLFSSAYATVMGILPPLITDRTAVISDALNHNSIINAIALGRPAEKRIYRHLDMDELERHLLEAARTCTRAIIVTDGVFSMRGVHAPLERMRAIVDRFDAAFAENAILIVDDSHGVGALGSRGRGAEEVTHPGAADLLIDRFRSGLASLDLETLPGEHPVVPLMVRDTERTSRIVRHLRDAGILATGLNYPVVPKGDEEIRFQISADHTAADLDEALAALRRLPG
jgi:glycine C-acetyltransferase